MEGNRARGVVIASNGREATVYADREVLVEMLEMIDEHFFPKWHFPLPMISEDKENPMRLWVKFFEF